MFDVHLSQQFGDTDWNGETASAGASARQPDVSRDPDLHEAFNIYEKLINGTIPAEEVCLSNALARINDRL